MGRIKLKLKNWPFEKGQKVQLIWIGEPFKENNKWMIDTYFCDGKVTKKVIQDWANIHFLSIDKYYTDGDLNSGEIIDDEGTIKTINIDLSNIMPKYNESDWNIKKSNYKSKSRTFSFWKNNVLYTIPIIEIVRTVLAPNSFMLNTILYNDIWEDYFLYNLEENKLKLTFSNEYRTTCLKSEYYNHLAWMLTNQEILNMCNEIGYNMFTMNGFKFDFNIPKFKIKARAKENNYGFTIVEILNVYEKEIKVHTLEVYHPSFENKKKTDEHKKRIFIGLNNDNEDRVIDNSVDGANKLTESISDKSTIQEYINIPILKKEKKKQGFLRMEEDNDTLEFIKDDNMRTLSCEGGLKQTNGIEIVGNEQRNIELLEYISILELLSEMEDIVDVSYIVVYLPYGGKYSFLKNGIMRRKCVIGKINMIDKSEILLLEIERENKALSTIELKYNKHINWEKIYSIMLKGIVKKSGRWSNEIIEKLRCMDIKVNRINHIRGTNKEKAIHIYNSIKKLGVVL